MAILRMDHLVALFLAKGACPDEHAIGVASWMRNAEVLQQLLDRDEGHPPPTAIITAVSSPLGDEIEVARILIDRGRLDVNYVPDQKFELAAWGTALTAAVSISRAKSVMFLLEHGADANLAAGKYGTPLQWAARLGWSNLVPLLVAGRGDPNYVDDKYPYCPLYIAYEQLLPEHRKHLGRGGQERFELLAGNVQERCERTIRELQKAGATLLSPQVEDARNGVDFSAILELHERYKSGLPIP
jgi:hypothetical protein